MRYGIFSDVHANLEALDAVIEALKNESIDKYLCAGDVVGYAVNPNECIEKTKALAMITVAGNHDWASVDLFGLDYFNPQAYQAVIWTRKNLSRDCRYFLEALKLVYKNKDLTLVHGTLSDPQDFNYMTNGDSAEATFRLLENNVCFLGHSHIAGVFIEGENGDLVYREDDLDGNFIDIKEGNKYIINVGSVGQPRDGNPKAAFSIYDTDKKRAWVKRISYDIKKTREKIIQAGLPRVLGDRLLAGK